MTLKDRAKIILEEINELHTIPSGAEDDVIRGIMLGLLKLEIQKEGENA